MKPRRNSRVGRPMRLVTTKVSYCLAPRGKVLYCLALEGKVLYCLHQRGTVRKVSCFFFKSWLKVSYCLPEAEKSRILVEMLRSIFTKSLVLFAPKLPNSHKGIQGPPPVHEKRVFLKEMRVFTCFFAFRRLGVHGEGGKGHRVNPIP